jgi:fatty-acid desaturase
MKTEAWHRTLGAWCLIPTLFLVKTSFWLLLSLAVYLCIALTVTVGYHRLFTHKSFKCSDAWYNFFAIFGTLTMNSSPISWCATHAGHHRYTDTEKDPYESSWKYFFQFKSIVGTPTKNEVLMMRNPLQKFLYENSLSLVLITLSLMCIISPQLALYGYVLPITSYLVVSGLHTIFAHGKEGIRNLWLLEYILPMAGEWNHKNHHDYPASESFKSKSYFFDMGLSLIRLIRNDSKPTATH